MSAAHRTFAAQPATSEAAELRLLSAGLTTLVLLLSSSETADVESARLRVAAALLASVWAAPLTLVAGLRLHPSWRVVQPFRGGVGFVVLQATGWLLHACTVLAFVVALLNPNAAAAAPRALRSARAGKRAAAPPRPRRRCRGAAASATPPEVTRYRDAAREDPVPRRRRVRDAAR